jgi:hypothetical protein
VLQFPSAKRSLTNVRGSDLNSTFGFTAVEPQACPDVPNLSRQLARLTGIPFFGEYAINRPGRAEPGCFETQTETLRFFYPK